MHHWTEWAIWQIVRPSPNLVIELYTCLKLVKIKSLVWAWSTDNDLYLLALKMCLFFSVKALVLPPFDLFTFLCHSLPMHVTAVSRNILLWYWVGSIHMHSYTSPKMDLANPEHFKCNRHLPLGVLTNILLSDYISTCLPSSYTCLLQWPLVTYFWPLVTYFWLMLSRLYSDLLSTHSSEQFCCWTVKSTV